MVTRKTCSGAGTSTGAPARAGLQKGPAVCQGWSNLEKSSLLKNADEATAEALSEGASRCREEGLRVFRWCVRTTEFWRKENQKWERNSFLAAITLAVSPQFLYDNNEQCTSWQKGNVYRVQFQYHRAKKGRVGAERINL